MEDWKKMYEEKKKSAEELVKLFENGDKCLSNGQIAEPIGMLKALVKRAKEENLKGIEHYILLPMQDQDYMAPGVEEHLRHVSHFISGYDRKPIWEGRADYLPSHYSLIPQVWRDVYGGPDVFYATVSPMDEHGYFSCGTAADLAEIRYKAKKILLEVNKTMPRSFGTFIHISEVTALMEYDEPITEVPAPPISKEDEIIGQLIADEIPDGATLQLGIGAIPNAVAKALMHKKDLGVHSEMFCDAMVDLFEAGALNNKKKNIHKGKCVASFTFGSRKTYGFIDNNPAVEFLPVDYVNDPRVVAQMDNFISINSLMEIDLFGQVCSESQGVMNFSGVGGQMDFIKGATWSKGGKSFLAFKSTAGKGKISKIKPILTEGSVVSTTRNDVDYIVTEYGMVRLKGKTVAERAEALISIAHPDFREWLTEEAKKMHLIK